MGKGIVVVCKKCGFTKTLCVGSGMLYPIVYEETIKKAREGELGNELQKFLSEHPDGMINCEDVLLLCSDCGRFDTDMDLSMYVPRKVAVEKDQMKQSSSFAVGDGFCPVPWELEKSYRRIGCYKHICPECEKRMRVINEDQMQKMQGMHRFSRIPSELNCPECREKLWVDDKVVQWD